MVVAPHTLAAEAGAEILRSGGTAFDAMIAAAATIAVVYPHMNSLGGDGFWLVSEPGRPPKVIEACGPAGSKATAAFYQGKGFGEIPVRGPLAALTVAGVVGGWQKAHEIASAIGGGLPLRDLLGFAIGHAKAGSPVSRSQARLTRQHLEALKQAPGFAQVFLKNGEELPEEGELQKQPRLADTLDHLAHEGLEEFYRGDVGASISDDLEEMGAPLTRADLQAYRAQLRNPLKLRTSLGTLYNAPPPTQGLASLAILGIFDELKACRPESTEYFHGLVEATKKAYILRDRVATDPRYSAEDPKAYLTQKWMAASADEINAKKAAPWPHQSQKGDTVWMGAVDSAGRSVSYIQSIYWEFGSGCVLPHTGITWQNRGSSFQLHPEKPQFLLPGRLPFHTLNPAMARLDDGRTMVYGTMGGEGQPQTQAAIFTRAVLHGLEPAQAITAPRWLLGRTWGGDETCLRVENRFDGEALRGLDRLGHEIEVLDEDYSDTMGHAGMIIGPQKGQLLGAHDIRADGGAEIG
ncbi:gamma-glutamyltransferase family protein [Flexibacterium corallicola]|uniref:gamma-glutamyltransferase family protein n=1 Tax=Flexibacterium corallicola TaxID=3037259 RepID=UPI00286EB7CA|nr:gamma-glutamyltransferase [Pseudovibrio sp. M1P-2-3]